MLAVAHGERLNRPSSFMPAGGVSATSEMSCLTGNGERRGLKRLTRSSCRAGQARDLEPPNWASKQCLAVPSGAVAGVTMKRFPAT